MPAAQGGTILTIFLRSGETYEVNLQTKTVAGPRLNGEVTYEKIKLTMTGLPFIVTLVGGYEFWTQSPVEKIY